MKPLRIGILGTAGIARKNWKAIASSGNCVVAAVASRDLKRGRQFIGDCQSDFPFPTVPEALGSYEEMLTSPQLDAVYVPLPTGLRKEYVLRAAQHGKHILCEKPCAPSTADLEEMLAACQKHSVQFLDGVMFMHNQRLPKVRKILDDGRSVGPIRRISSAFTFYPGDEFFRTNIRADGTLEPFGCLGDLGWYSIRFALWTLNWEMPQSVAGKVLSEAEHLPGRPGAPTEFAGTLYYPGGVTAEFYAAFRAAKQQWVQVSGENGWLRLPDFVHAYNTYEPAFSVNEEWITVSGGVNCPAGSDPAEFGHPTAQDTNMWRNFANQIFSGRLNSEWPMWALKTQQVLDACMQAAKR